MDSLDKGKLIYIETRESEGLIGYWKNLAMVLFGCLCLFVFDICERGVQLQNPFYSIWVTDLGTNLALGFIVLYSFEVKAKTWNDYLIICLNFW